MATPRSSAWLGARGGPQAAIEVLWGRESRPHREARPEPQTPARPGSQPSQRVPSGRQEFWEALGLPLGPKGPSPSSTLCVLFQAQSALLLPRGAPTKVCPARSSQQHLGVPLLADWGLLRPLGTSKPLVTSIGPGRAWCTSTPCCRPGPVSLALCFLCLSPWFTIIQSWLF